VASAGPYANHLQITCTSLQTNNHASTLTVTFFRPDDLPATQQHQSTKNVYIFCLYEGIYWHISKLYKHFQCFDAVGWVVGRSSGLQKLSGEVLARLSVCSIFAYGPADATATPSSLVSLKSRMVYLSGAVLPTMSWKKGH